MQTDITARNADTFLVRFVKPSGLKFCSENLPGFLAKATKHKM